MVTQVPTQLYEWRIAEFKLSAMNLYKPHSALLIFKSSSPVPPFLTSLILCFCSFRFCHQLPQVTWFTSSWRLFLKWNPQALSIPTRKNLGLLLPVEAETDLHFSKKAVLETEQFPHATFPYKDPKKISLHTQPSLTHFLFYATLSLTIPQIPRIPQFSNGYSMTLSSSLS